MLSTTEIAEDIAEELLFRTGRAMLDGNEDDLVACFWVPAVFETIEGVSHIQTIKELRNVYRNVYRNLKRNGVADMARTVVSAQFIDNNIIGTTHVAVRLGPDGEHVGKPYPVYSTLKQLKSEWRIESCIYAVLNDPRMNKALSLQPQKVS